ncbi:Rer1 family protein [Ostertagia ostertagi]
MDDDLRERPGVVSRFFHSLEVKYQYYLDKLTPQTTVRWLMAVVAIITFCARILYLQGFYIVAYAVGIYYLNLLLLFLTPSIDPALEDDDDGPGFYIVAYAVGIYYLNLLLLFLTPSIDPALEDDDDGPVLPSRTNDEFRPFMRRLPEFKCWHSAMKATLIAIICTFFEFFNVPVFWPILVMYFIILFFLTMKRQIMHMIKYKYIPFTVGKPRMAGKEDTGKSSQIKLSPTSRSAETHGLLDQDWN